MVLVAAKQGSMNWDSSLCFLCTSHKMSLLFVTLPFYAEFVQFVLADYFRCEHLPCSGVSWNRTFV